MGPAVADATVLRSRPASLGALGGRSAVPCGGRQGPAGAPVRLLCEAVCNARSCFSVRSPRGRQPRATRSTGPRGLALALGGCGPPAVLHCPERRAFALWELFSSARWDAGARLAGLLWPLRNEQIGSGWWDPDIPFFGSIHVNASLGCAPWAPLRRLACGKLAVLIWGRRFSPKPSWCDESGSPGPALALGHISASIRLWALGERP